MVLHDHDQIWGDLRKNCIKISLKLYTNVLSLNGDLASWKFEINSWGWVCIQWSKTKEYYPRSRSSQIDRPWKFHGAIRFKRWALLELETENVQM